MLHNLGININEELIDGLMKDASETGKELIFRYINPSAINLIVQQNIALVSMSFNWFCFRTTETEFAELNKSAYNVHAIIPKYMKQSYLRSFRFNPSLDRILYLFVINQKGLSVKGR